MESLKKLQKAKHRFTRAFEKVRESRKSEWGGEGQRFKGQVNHAKYFGLCPKGMEKLWWIFMQSDKCDLYFRRYLSIIYIF